MWFRHFAWKEFKELSGTAITKLVPLLFIYLCEQGFLVPALIKTK